MRYGVDFWVAPLVALMVLRKRQAMRQLTLSDAGLEPATSKLGISRSIQMS